jgi:ketosteroid isomerase-like protein
MKSDAEAVRSAFEAFNEGGTEALIPHVHPDGEFTTPPDLASEPDTYRGHDGVRRYFDSFYEVMDEIRIEPVSVEEVEGRVVIEFTLLARGKSTGIETGQKAWGLVDVVDERIHRLTFHRSRSDALAAI